MTRIRLRAGAPDGRKADSVATTGDPRFGAHCPDGDPTHDGEAVMNGAPRLCERATRLKKVARKPPLIGLRRGLDVFQ